MIEILHWIFYIFLVVAVALAAMNQWRLWKNPYLFKGDTGPPGIAGVQGPPGVCFCDECNPPMDNPKLRGGPLTKEDVYNLPQISDDID